MNRVLKGFFLQKFGFGRMLLTYLVGIVVVLNVLITGEDQFSVLSAQFIKGYLHLPEVVGDAVLFNGKYFWHLGPFPAMLLLPFSLITLKLFDCPMPQGLLNIGFVLCILVLAYKISLKNGFDKKSSLWISIAVVFASVFFLSAYLPWSWHFSQTVTFLFGLLALYEYFERKRPLFIGICHAFIFMTRFTAGLGILFYLMDIAFSRDVLREKAKRLPLMVIPLVIAGVILLGYNYIRFENIFDNGYTTSNNWVPSSESFRYEMLHYGLFSLKNIPTNIYYYFINMPSPVLERAEGFHREIFKTDPSMIIHLVFPFITVSTPGVSLFVVAPIFLLMFRNKLKTKVSKLAMFTGILILVFLLTYYWTGWTQVGPRYIIDLLPFMFILFLESYKEKRITFWQKCVITFSSLFNIYLFISLSFSGDV